MDGKSFLLFKIAFLNSDVGCVEKTSLKTHWLFVLANSAGGVVMIVNGNQRVKFGQIFDNNLEISPIRAMEITVGTTPHG